MIPSLSGTIHTRFHMTWEARFQAMGALALPTGRTVQYGIVLAALCGHRVIATAG
jgi:hypothetical protein